MKEFENNGHLMCYWSNLKEHPKCPHGPTLLFGREINGQVKKFYACSACRDRKLCSFFLEYGKEKTQNNYKKILPYYPQQKLYIKFNELMSENPLNRMYCHDCEKLLKSSEKQKHENHHVVVNISDFQMRHPTKFLKPLDNSKKEAQFLFSEKSLINIIEMLTSLNAKNVLCIGTPRIHEYLRENKSNEISSILLDFDGRFHNFFGPLEFCWYNLFNHHFFQDNSEKIFEDFLMQDGGKNMFLVCDPPFGGRVEPMSQTLNTISNLHKKLNNISCKEDELKIFFIFPYFMESILKEKSNPSNISNGLKDLKMSDYKVSYENHPLFVSQANNQEQGSQIRIFTNVSLNLIKLPELDGYKYCKRCEKWVSPENKHCKVCNSCTSKDGRRYKHCKLCKRCVKPTWTHCSTCDRCALASHKCGKRPNVGHCFKCNQIGHTIKECISKDQILNIDKKSKKRTHEAITEIYDKKRKLNVKKNFKKQRSQKLK